MKRVTPKSKLGGRPALLVAEGRVGYTAIKKRLTRALEREAELETELEIFNSVRTIKTRNSWFLSLSARPPIGTRNNWPYGYPGKGGGTHHATDP